MLSSVGPHGSVWSNIARYPLEGTTQLCGVHLALPKLTLLGILWRIPLSSVGSISLSPWIIIAGYPLEGATQRSCSLWSPPPPRDRIGLTLSRDCMGILIIVCAGCLSIIVCKLDYVGFNVCMLNYLAQLLL